MLFGTPKNPKGPQGKWDDITTRLSGTVLYFSLPSTNLAVVHDQYDPESDINLYDNEPYWVHPDANDVSRPPRVIICRRNWEFNGLRWSRALGGYGSLDLDIRIELLPDFTSLFRPRRRECAIERYIYSSGSFLKQPNYNRLSYSLNKKGDQVWSCYEVANRRYVCQLPITNTHMLTFEFLLDIYHPKTQVVKAMMALAHKIMGTVKVELSEDAKRMKHEAQTQYPWEKLQETLPPYDFEYKETIAREDFSRMLFDELGDIDVIPRDEFRDRVDKRVSDQKLEHATIRERVLASHMRFTELEAQDAKKYKAEEA